MFLDYLWLIIIGVILLFLIIMFFVLVPVKTWFKAMFSGVYVRANKLSSMKLRRLNPTLIVDEYIYARKAGIQISIDDLETHFISGGNIRNVVDAMIATKNVGMDLSIDTAKAIDLSGRNVNQIVQESIRPKEIEIPKISAFARDGVELKVNLKLTLKTNLARFLGGAGEDTIISRVSEGVVCIVGSSKTHTELLQDPDLISRFVETRAVDEQTAYDMISVDVIGLDVGRDLMQERKDREQERERKLAISQAEEKKLLAIVEQEKMKIKIEEENAKRVAVEAEIPKALIQAFHDGKIGVMDYYKMQNMIADTNMRKALGSNDDKSNGARPQQSSRRVTPLYDDDDDYDEDDDDE